ncbi:MAG: MFS transporter, partial [Planctomycetales bacterium]|nr:MFS transporter [Planctomycetales bacterium]
IFLTVFIDLLGFGMVLPLLPIYAKQFGADPSGVSLGLLMASFSIMQFLFAPLWGRLSDRIGRRPVLMVGLFGSVIFYLMFGIATVYQSLAMLFVARIGAGVAGATISTAQAYIADTTPLEKRARGMALIGMAFGMGFTFGPLFGYLAVPGGEDATPGPWPGYAAAILSTIALLLAIFILPESLHERSESAARKRFNLSALSAAVRTPSIAMILLTIFLVVFSFSNLETTLSLILKGQKGVGTPFEFTFGEVLLTFAFIGVVLAFVQGGLVRPLAGRVPEAALAGFGAVLEIISFAWIIAILGQESPSMASVFGMLALCTTGFAFVTPSLNSLLSRRSDPASQGGILGLAQSVNSLARILGSGCGIPMLMIDARLPYYVAGGLMLLGLAMTVVVGFTGRDFQADKSG